MFSVVSLSLGGFTCYSFSPQIRRCYADWIIVSDFVRINHQMSKHNYFWRLISDEVVNRELKYFTRTEECLQIAAQHIGKVPLNSFCHIKSTFLLFLRINYRRRQNAGIHTFYSLRSCRKTFFSVYSNYEIRRKP